MLKEGKSGSADLEEETEGGKLPGATQSESEQQPEWASSQKNQNDPFCGVAETEEAVQNLEIQERENYGKVKAAILRGEALRTEMQRQHFRQFCCQELGDPRRFYGQLHQLCLQWLKPERHTKEQILELLILEQFLVSLPPDLRIWIRAGRPDTCSQAVALVEDFLSSLQEAKSGSCQVGSEFQN
uniref:SCAN box domain-containing protein n=1 Tax=Naja naja TaxID=35670 RepID=A0A8C7E167_NAJNA